MKPGRLLLLSALASGLLLVSSCSKEGCTDPTAVNYDPDAGRDDGSCEFNLDTIALYTLEFKTTYSEIALASYQDASDAVENLRNEIDGFVNNPTESRHQACKSAWLAARDRYALVEALRYSSGPIDEEGLQDQINAWPLDESFIDYVVGNSGSGIINNAATYPEISDSLLLALNQAGGTENVAIGFHAIEFLLWGQDSDAPGEITVGQRSHTDFANGGTASNQARRREYLMTCADLLFEHMLLVVEAWSQSYRETFLAQNEDEVLTNILTGLATFSKSELAGKRMLDVLENPASESEYGSFSDNTDFELILNAQGIRNIYVGSYTRADSSVVSGRSLQEIISVASPSLAAEIDALSRNSIAQCEDIPAPFDLALTAEVSGGDGPIMTAINTLQEQGDKMSEAATALGYSISTDLP